MVYGYETNKKFIDKSHQLLDKLDKKDLWNKDTLVIALDKSVRPLAYTLRKLSKEENKTTPDIRFFNYSSHGLIDSDKAEEIAKYFKSQLDPKKLSKYQNILILDDHIYSGNTLKNAKKVLQKYFSKMKDEKKIDLACLGITKSHDSRLKKKDFIFVAQDLRQGPTGSLKTGITDNSEKQQFSSPINKSMRTQTKIFYEGFIQNRKQLSSDIKKYVVENNLQGDKIGGNALEKSLQTFSFILIISGLLFGYGGITGNIIGISSLIKNPLGMSLFVVGILGLFFSRKFKK